MLLPMCCFTCGKPVADLWFRYTNLLAAGGSRQEILDHLDLKRYCCRRILLTHVELSEKFSSIQQRIETRD